MVNVSDAENGDLSPTAQLRAMRDAQGRRRAALDELRSSVRRALRDGQPVAQVREAVPAELERVNAAHEMDIGRDEAVPVVEAAIDAHSRSLDDNPFMQLAQGGILAEPQPPVAPHDEVAPEPRQKPSQKTSRDPAMQARIDELREQILAEAKSKHRQDPRVIVRDWAHEQAIPRDVQSVLVALASYTDEYGVCFPSVETISRKCKLEERQTYRHLTTLQLEGLIANSQRGRGRKYQLAFWRRSLSSETGEAR